jgi:putative nucleotidyltransferase with HDIG domain
MNQRHGQLFLERVAATNHELPFAPDLIHRLFAATAEDSTVSIADVARDIAEDQGLTARVLKLANSTYYGLQSQVTTVQRAATVLGMAKLRDIVMALTVQSLTRLFPQGAVFDIMAYWRHQVAVARVAQHLARKLDSCDPDLLYTSAMLHDLGKLIVVIHAYEDHEAIEALRRAKNLSMAKAEEAHWGLDHGVIGALVLKSWNLPLALTEPVNWHHFPSLAADSRVPASLLALADAVYYRLEAGGEPTPRSERLEELAIELELNLTELKKDAVAIMRDDTLDHFVSCLVA